MQQHAFLCQLHISNLCLMDLTLPADIIGLSSCSTLFCDVTYTQSFGVHPSPLIHADIQRFFLHIQWELQNT